jgi:hypothetical protein
MRANPRINPTIGARTMKTAVLASPDGMSAPGPALAVAAPAKPPISAWEELDGMP